MTAEENKATFLRFIKELAKGNLAIIDEVCAPNFGFYSPNFPNWPRGFEGARELAVAGRSLFADTESQFDDIIAVEDKVVLRWTMRGTYIGEPKNGFPNPGERFSMGAIAIYRFVDGKIVDDWGIQVSCPTGTTPWGP